MTCLGKLFIIAGPSGVGKATLVKALLAADDKVRLSISHTTRPRRHTESDGTDYHFVSTDTFHQLAQSGFFLEYAEVYGYYYGTSHSWIREALNSGSDVVLEIDIQGAAQVRRIFPEAVGVFILPSSLNALVTRLQKRGTDQPDIIKRRLSNVQHEVDFVGDFDYLIINAQIEQAGSELISIVRAERCRCLPQSRQHAALLRELKMGTLLTGGQ